MALFCLLSCMLVFTWNTVWSQGSDSIQCLCRTASRVDQSCVCLKLDGTLQLIRAWVCQQDHRLSDHSLITFSVYFRHYVGCLAAAHLAKTVRKDHWKFQYILLFSLVSGLAVLSIAVLKSTFYRAMAHQCHCPNSHFQSKGICHFANLTTQDLTKNLNKKMLKAATSNTDPVTQC